MEDGCAEGVVPHERRDKRVDKNAMRLAHHNNRDRAEIEETEARSRERAENKLISW